MLPTLFAFGPIVIKSFNVMLFLAMFFGMFVFWRKGKEEHYDEMMLFDGLLLAHAFGAVAARAAYIVLHFDQFGLNLIAWLDIFSHPGLMLFVFYLVSALYLFRFSRKKKWDEFEILDFWILGVTASLVFVWIGYFLAGASFGQPTSLPWGIIFPGLLERHHPLQLYFVLFYGLLFWYLSWVEFRYRTFAWYRAGKNTAQTGFLLSMFLLFTGLVSLLLSFISIAGLVVFSIRIDMFVSALMVLVGAGMLYARSGRDLPFKRKNPRQAKLDEIAQK